MILIFREFHFFSRAKRGTSSSIHACASPVRTLALHPFAEHLQERSPDLVSTSNLYRKPSHKIDLCPLFVPITVISILTYNNRMSWTFLCSWTEFSHGRETFLPLAKMIIYRKYPRTPDVNTLYELIYCFWFLKYFYFFLIFIYDFLYFNMIYFNFISENIIRYIWTENKVYWSL